MNFPVLFAWYFFSALAGFAVLPLLFRLLPYLPDRGYSLARAAGLLVWGFVFWWLTSLGVTPNNPAGILTALVLIAAPAWFLLRRHFAELGAWFRSNRRVWISTEILFMAAFVGWALMRSIPDVFATEKPMELAFINAIMRSPVFPPSDPWLSGYSISYYYSGYVMAALLAQVSGATGGEAFNLMMAQVFALAAIGAFGVVYNLLQRRKADGRNIAGALLAPIILQLLGNLGGFFQLLHRRGLFWATGPDGGLSSPFWTWLDIQDLSTPPPGAPAWSLGAPGAWWWWRASRVVTDRNMTGEIREIIDEFPFFSYMLADLHPHVLAVPFVLLAVGFGMNLFFAPQEKTLTGRGLFAAVKAWVEGGPPALQGLRLWAWLREPFFWASAVILGGLSFLNTWDFPMYVALFALVIAYHGYLKEGWSVGRIGDFVETGLLLGIAGAGLYLPFYIGFSSQAGGIIPSGVFITRGAHLWVMFAPLMLPILIFLFWRWRAEGRAMTRPALRFTLMLLAVLTAASLLFSWAAGNLSVLGNALAGDLQGGGSQMALKMMQAGDAYLAQQGASDAGMGLLGSLMRRFTQPGAWLTLGSIIFLCWAVLGTGRKSLAAGEQNNPSTAFVLLVVLIGAGLTLAPDYFYLRDQFGYRINTIFKFYFQAWILWSLAAVYGLVVLLQELRGWKNYLVGALVGLVWMAGFVYPAFWLSERIDGAGNQPLEMDASQTYLSRYAADDLEAIRWLQMAPQGVVSEAVGGSYTGYARISAHSGIPTVIGWPGHESQWRGGSVDFNNRPGDIETLYRTSNWDEALAILTKYNIRYVYIGNLERSTYRVNETKFTNHMRPVFQNATAIIYEMTPQGSAVQNQVSP